MFPAPFKVVLDACVLFPLTLRDTLLRAAEAGFFQMYWSEEILDEVRRNLIATGTTDEQQAAKLIETMREAFPQSQVIGYRDLVPAMKNDPKDRHVAAAAVQSGAALIVTSNLKDFQTLPVGIEVQSPDDFLCSMFDLQPSAMLKLLRDQSAAMKKPPVTFEKLLTAMAKMVPEFISMVRESSSEKGR